MSAEAFLYDPYSGEESFKRFASHQEAKAWLLPQVVALLERRYRELPRIEQEEASLYFNSKGRVRKTTRDNVQELQDVTESFWSEFEEGALEWGIKPALTPL